MILNINQLRAFATAARLNSITEAARELMVTTPAVTMQIRRLELTLGVSLMYREGNSIQLTQAGKTVFLRSNRIFEEIKEMEAFLGKMTMDTLGILKIGCPQTPAKYIMPKVIAAFKKDYPDVKIVMGQGTSPEVMKGIQNQAYDLGVIHCGGRSRKMKVIPMVKEDILLVASPHSSNITAKEVSVAQLPAIPLIIPQYGSALREVVLAYLRRFNITPNIVLESANAELMKGLAIENQGACFMVKSALKDELEKGLLKVIPIIEGPPIIEYGIAYLQRKYLSPAAWAFVRFAERIGSTF
ncbi:MAG: LysR family transcriptional regulator [Proteobacteria bacterium]|nr:LysR family transcriptional regulator [Pseudomonadota bacterium]